ncbi:MAG: hypothetical protein M5U28_18120 [Sandaracinaceae bacterium]|nr:hypothetical protein [Sandaracinaceae bacterium]
MVLLTIAGCDGPLRSSPDGGGSEDGGGTRRDTGVPDPDGGVDDDAGASEDAGPPDAGPPDSGPPPEPCDAPGTIETVACGMCGTVDRFCGADMVWSYGVCGGEGECLAGTTDTTTCGDCGTQMRRCNASCAWESVGACTGEGECTPGAMTQSGDGCPAGQLRDVTCDETCTYVPTSACSAEACPTPGAIEMVPCGMMCGTRERFCNASHVWEYGACGSEGVCVAGTSGTIPCGMCGTQAARCDASCAWVPVSGSTCTGEGVCSPGTRIRTATGCPSGQTHLMECGATCGYTIEVEPCRSDRPGRRALPARRDALELVAVPGAARRLHQPLRRPAPRDRGRERGHRVLRRLRRLRRLARRPSRPESSSARGRAPRSTPASRRSPTWAARTTPPWRRCTS